MNRRTIPVPIYRVAWINRDATTLVITDSDQRPQDAMKANDPAVVWALPFSRVPVRLAEGMRRRGIFDTVRDISSGQDHTETGKEADRGRT